MSDIVVELAEPIRKLFTGRARYRIAYGGRGSTKSWGFARMLIARAYQKPLRILCVRELQNSIKDSVHKLLADQIRLLKLPGFTITNDSIRHVNGSEFIFKGLRTNAHEVKSMEGIDICWPEEAQKISNDSWEVLIPTIRKQGSEIWITLNPEYKSDATSQRFIENTPPDSKIIKINYDQNPWFTEALDKERLYLKRIDPIAYENVWLGEYKDPAHGGRVVKGWSFANLDDSIQYDPHSRLYLTCDFNVDPMCWAVAHIRVIGGERHYHFFDEIIGEGQYGNIHGCLEKFVAKYGSHKAGIIVTGDANSGRARLDADQLTRTRWTVMKQGLSDYGVKNFALDTNRSNPRIQTRIQAFEPLVCNVDGLRRVKVHPDCKQINHIMEVLSYVPGSDEVYEPPAAKIKDKPELKFDKDDMFDAVTYLTWKYDPIKQDMKHGPKQQFRTASFVPAK